MRVSSAGRCGMRVRLFSRSRLAVCFAACFCAVSIAQDASPAPAKPETALQGDSDQASAPTMTIRETVRRVIVDVMVRDSSGKPVHGLTADDFSIVEDNQPQRVLSFDVYDFDKQSISRGPDAPPLPPNVFVNIPAAPERGPLYVMLYDLVNTERE